MNAPIELVLYDKNDEPLKTLRRSTVPWGVMKKALSLMDTLDIMQKVDDKQKAQKTGWQKFAEWCRLSKTENETEVSLRMLEEFIVEFFGNQCTVDELKGADTAELMLVLQSIMGRASSVMPANPRKPQRMRQK